MKKFRNLVVGWAIVFSLVAAIGFSGIALAGSADTAKPKSIVGIWQGTVYISNSAGFSSDTITIAILEQGSSKYMLNGKIILNGVESPIYGFVDGYSFYAYGENIEVEGQIVRVKKARRMMVLIGNTSATPSCMAADTLKEAKLK